MLIRVFFQFRFQWSKSVVESQVICKIRLYTNVWLFRDYPMFIGVFPSFTVSGRSRSGVFCKVCFTYTYVWLFRGYSMLIRGFSQFRFQCTNVWLFRDYPMFIGVFPSFTVSGRSRSGVFCKVCFTYTYVWLFRGYSMLIRGFSQFRFQWSRPFLRHADKHISDHLGTIQCWYGFFPSFVFGVQTVFSGVVSTSCWYARVWLFKGLFNVNQGVFPISLSMVEAVPWVVCKARW